MVEKIILINKNAGTSLPISMEAGTESYLLSSVDWGVVESSRKSYKFIDQVGVYVTKTTLESRNITIIGWVVADTQKEMSEKKKFLNFFVNPMQRVDLIYDEYRIEGIPTSSIKYGKEMPENNEVMCKFMIDLFCPDPMFYTKESSKVSIASWMPKFHFPLRIIKGGRSNLATTSTINVSRNGIRSIKMNGGTNQPGTGDPSPTNIRPIYGVGQLDKKAEFPTTGWTKSGSDFYKESTIADKGISSPLLSHCLPYVGAFDSTAAFSAAAAPYTFAIGSGAASSIRGRIYIKAPCTTVEELSNWMQTINRAVYYQSTSYPTAAQVYIGFSVTDANGYHGYAAGPTAPLHDGDTLTWSGGSTVEIVRAKQSLVFNGTENWIVNDVAAIPGGHRFDCDNYNYPDAKSNIGLVCSHYKADVGKSNCVWLNHTVGSFGVRIGGLFADLSSFKSYLAAEHAAGTPVTIVYELATPATETVPISEPLKNAEGEATLVFESQAVIEYRVLGPNGIIMGLRSPSTIATIENQGAMPCGMIITFQASGELTNPKIVDINTQQYIRLECTMQAGEVIQISTLPNNKTIKKIVGEVETNAFDLLDFENSVFLSLAVGTNYLRYDADSGLNNLSVLIGYEPGLLEVQK